MFKNNFYSAIIIFCLMMPVSGKGSGYEVVAPQNLTCEYKQNPLGIDNVHPRFFWEISNAQRGTRQTAYQVILASHPSLLTASKADQWNSGKVQSSENIQVHYTGKPLRSSVRYYWRIRFWNEKDEPSSFSKTAWFETALLSANDWKGNWIYNGTDAPENEADLYGDIPAPLFRKGFRIEKEIQSARLYFSGLGYGEAYLNGKKISNDILNPGWTNYAKRVQYNTYDVTNLLTQNNNVLGVLLGNGWYNPLPLALFNRLNLRNILTIGQPKFIAQLLIRYKDGSQALIVSDESWTTGNSPILRNNVYLGEKYDARLEQEGWSTGKFNASSWKKAKLSTPPGGQLVAQIQPPVRITREVKPVNITEPKPGVYIFDMGQNFAGCAKLRVTGKEGTTVQLRYGELLHEDGSLNDRTTIACHIWEGSYVKPRPGAPKNADQRDTYILKGKGEEVYNSRFTFHGFRYVEVTGFPGKPPIDALTGLRMNSDLEQVGNFECSNALLNQVQENTRWTFLSNVFSIESDCPGREKFGYGGDIVTAGEAYFYNYAMPGFYTKTVHDFRDDQRPSGGMPECAPDNHIYDEGLTPDTGPIGWMIAHPFLVDNLLHYYGDADLVKEQYEPVKRLTDFITSNAKDHIIDKGIGDHGTIAEKDLPVSGTAFYYYCTKKASEYAKVLGYTADETKYAALAAAIKDAFISKFLNKETGAVGKGTQADQSFALYYDLIPDAWKDKVLTYLETEVVKADEHTNTGIFGAKFLWNVLRQTRNDALAYRINTKETYPSYGFMIKNGATTIWEHWRGRGSHNHPMYGSVSEWLFKSVAGITAGDGSIGFDKIVIRPFIADSLQWMKGSYHSIRGIIACEWKKMANNKVSMTVTIPGNTTAKIYIPQSDKTLIKEGGKSLESLEGIHEVLKEDNYSVVSAGAGVYTFIFPLGR